MASATTALIARWAQPALQRSKLRPEQCVVGFIFLVSIVNLGLGYVAAIALVEPPLWSGLSELWRRRKDKTAEELALLLDAAQGAGAAVLDNAEVDEMTQAAAAIAGLEELPEDWLGQLAAE